jgi:hypothetical protein
MLVMLVRRVVCRRYIVSYPSTRKCSLFNEDIRDETVDNRWACWRIRSRPQYDTGSGKYLKRVEHFENPEMWNALVEVSQLKARVIAQNLIRMRTGVLAAYQKDIR